MTMIASHHSLVGANGTSLDKLHASKHRSTLLGRKGKLGQASWILSKNHGHGAGFLGGKLENYILKRQWPKFFKFLESVDGANELSRQAQLPIEGNAGTLLHLACQGHPPLEVVEILHKANPSWIDNSQNAHKHTPLHVAAAWGASPNAIQFLTHLRPQNASRKDVHGRTPLHLHCDYCCAPGSCDPESFTDEEHQEHFERCQEEMRNTSASQIYDVFVDYAVFSCKKRTHGPIPKVIEILYDAAPVSINLEDSDGMNPIEYCLVHSASRQIIIKMQKMSVTQWRLAHQKQVKKVPVDKKGSTCFTNVFHQLQMEATSLLMADMTPVINSKEDCALPCNSFTQLLDQRKVSMHVESNIRDQSLPQPHPRRRGNYSSCTDVHSLTKKMQAHPKALQPPSGLPLSTLMQASMLVESNPIGHAESGQALSQVYSGDWLQPNSNATFKTETETSLSPATKRNSLKQRRGSSSSILSSSSSVSLGKGLNLVSCGSLSGQIKRNVSKTGFLKRIRRTGFP